MADETHTKKADSGKHTQPQEKSEIAAREAEILEFWKEQDIFNKTLEKPAAKGDFVFYDGPPFATGSPHYGHILAGTMKDVIPRFRSMQGYHVPRRWGWDCHGLPIENLIEKELNLKSKKDIENLGIEKFNDAARASVLRYDHEWKNIVPRTGRFVDMDNAYVTMDWRYSESIWWSFKTLFDKNLIYQGFKSMFLCPRCETTLSNFEVTQGYKDISDISVYVKFELVEEPKTYVLAWTTTPWTLPGNVALAVNSEIDYAKVLLNGEHLILAKERLAVLKDADYKVVQELKGKALVGKKYKPIFNYYQHAKLQHIERGWQIVPASFVTTTDGTGVVHIAPAFGEDDYNLAQKESLPFIQHVGVDGKFKKEVTDFAGLPVKPIDTKEDPQAHQKTDVEVIKYLAAHGSLFAKEKLVHSYPHCWRCDTPLLNYATSSWFVKVASLRDKLVEENKKVHWVPQEMGEGRFGKWLEGARDWAVSRSRYWGAPLPVWTCKDCGRTEVFGSVEEIRNRTRRNTYYVVRHGESDHNVLNVASSDPNNPHHLTELGREQVTLTAQALKDKKIDLIVTSPLVRARETADVIIEELAYKGEVEVDDRITEFDFGDFNLKDIELYYNYYDSVKDRLIKPVPGGECINDIRARIGDFLYDIDSKHEGKTIVIVTHDGPASVLFAVAEGADDARTMDIWGLDRDFLSLGREARLDFAPLPHNRKYELDLHRPYIDELTFPCTCRETLRRVPEVFDTWYESGSMPYASIHYPFENKEKFDAGDLFPADFIAEGQDQTRGWFYVLLVLSVGLFGVTPYKNVIVNGTVLAEDGQKMSKRLKNYPEVTYILDRYGGDAMRYYLLSSPAVKAEDLAFSEKGVDEVVKKVIMRLRNVCSFYTMYASAHPVTSLDRPATKNILDLWILARLDETLREVTEALFAYELDRAARPLAGFIDDLSTWYLRRSRDRFKSQAEWSHAEGDTKERDWALGTTRYVLAEFSKIMAPFMPFTAEDVYLSAKLPSDPESVHLTTWPEHEKPDEKILETMRVARQVVEKVLSQRAAAKLKVRQPLALLSLRAKDYPLGDEYLEVIRDEVNVKKVVLDDKLGPETMIVLDTKLTPELIEEGQMREFVRSVQDLRKKEKLNPHDIVELVVDTSEEGRKLIEKYIEDISKTAQLGRIEFATVKGEAVNIDGQTFTLAFRK